MITPLSEKQKLTILGMAAGILCLFIALVFFAYFLIEDNTALIDWSIIPFIIASFLIYKNGKHIALFFIIAIALISISSFLYLVTLNNHNPTKTLKLDAISVFGYYFLMSAMLALVISITYSDGMKKVYVKSRKVLLPKIAPVHARLISVILLLLPIVLPIWPTGLHVPISGQPYIQISLSSVKISNQSSNSSLYSMRMNVAPFKDLLNPGLSNMRFYYPNGTSIQACLIEEPYYFGNTEDIVLKLNNKPNNYSDIVMYLMPFNTSFGRQFQLVTSISEFSNIKGEINASLGNLSGIGNYSYLHANYSGIGLNSSTKHINYVLNSYYITYNFGGIFSNVTLFANRSVSIFVIYNMTSNITTPILAGGNQAYASYINKFSEISYQKSLNITNLQMRINNSDTSSYVIVANEPTRLTMNLTTYYYGSVSYSSKLKLPVSISTNPQYSLGFLPEGLAYLVNYYNNETTPESIP